MSQAATLLPLPPVPRPAVVSRPRTVRLETSVPRLLHVTNGDCAADLLRLSGIPGTVTLTADVLHDGPVPPPTLAPERWRKVRARFLAESGYEGYDECLARLTEWDRALEAFRSYEEVVLWFEHDLFDQLHLIRLLDWFGRREVGWTRLSVVCIGEFPGIQRFRGLGQLEPMDFTSLLELRKPVTDEQIRLARNAWRVFCSAEPIGLELLLRRDTSALPFLAGALLRHLEEFPSTRNGLSRTEHQGLLAVAEVAGDGGAATFAEVFQAAQDKEERAFLGDLPFLQRLREMASRPRPLLRIEPGSDDSMAALQVTITPAGLEVLDGREDWVHIHGIDRWLGGVHLVGFESQWRWDPDRQRLAPTWAPAPPASAWP
ncbi:MAG TPA: hypothetical protein VEL74_13200 [Thermoanaerobaculia bacterium]|nr:hypothetical protein [Thermoanaerobaculia bacterium]